MRVAAANATGHFELKGRAPGGYVVLAFGQIEYGAYMDAAFLKPFEANGTRVTIREKTRQTITVKAIPMDAH